MCCCSNLRLFDDLQPPDTPKKHLLARMLPRSFKKLKSSQVQNVLAPLYNLQYTPGAKVRPSNTDQI